MSEGPNPLGWALTFGDLVTNLLLFFIVLYAMSTVEIDKLLQLSDSMKKALHKTAVDSSSVGSALISDPRRAKVTAVSEAIEDAVKALGIEKGVTVSEDERGTIISLVDSFFFSSGQTSLNSQVKPILKEIGEFIRETNATVHVEGHTDNIEINKPPINSNWELSALRATEVVRFFIKEAKIPPTHLAAIGYGSTRPIVPNTTVENRDKNRRIDLILTNVVIRLKKPKNAEPTTLDIIGNDKEIKERVKSFQSESEINRPLEKATSP